ncbi:Octaprenyl diphosphate synthase / Dimethylallyltransferase / (2E,6E)-farnesyl diphosphate synthase / Geranylgeranyl diphosphate synthase [[Actinomadura] parvosata subsp. kistnae]|uniref:Polyprenyl diphosphate synthase n=1 Tax=[Actinomadura] parvosata subsp. kistnae TaxID=1909395 RepID=A0A1U9ZZG3_9ACTN|nr:polyprenyl synthetase family protein [Nonomuraea sp. ATCC 55076]AQZ63310.1 hypothetical protein BKM31_19225 [Nonomuraea sp. ATCC 55076]SPL99006.1 Octaprenyl diphosphate synthase / Dimethylallyltransferase / (2E,6E)-farnesyl diphosphate synthase / Geranylgeranyl diphosphate synthase [Actinomadura parvosata subsp. kistnae]
MPAALPPALPAHELLRMTSQAVLPVLQSAVDTLSPELRRAARFHFGFPGPDGAPPPGRVSRLRVTALALLCTSIDGGPVERGLPAAAAFTLTMHQAGIHDNITDHDAVRYGRPTLWRAFTLDHALQTGTALLTLAVRMLAVSGYRRRDQMTTALMDGVVGNSEGQLADLTLDYTTGGPVSPEACLAVAEAKTGPIIRAACRVGALAGTAGPEQVDDLAELGAPIALVMQLRNDLDDLWPPLTGDTTPRRTDLRHRKVTYPIAAALADTGRARDRLAAYLASTAEPSPQDLDDLVRAIERCGGRERTEAAIHQATAQARHRLGRAAPAPQAHADLLALIDLLQRS